MPENDLYRNLLTSEVYAILDGDQSFGEYESRVGKKIRIGLPYLSGPNLCDISTIFGKPETYDRSGGAVSRWQYVKNILEHCIANGTCSSFLRYLLERSHFQETLRGLEIDEIDEVYKKSVSAAIEGINKILVFSNSQLKYQGKEFVVVPANGRSLSDDDALDHIFEEDISDSFSALSGYTQCELLGQGGFGTVYRYHNQYLDMDFAVKIYNPWFASNEEREEGEKRFFREANMLFSVNSRHIVRIYDAGRVDGNPFIRMELIDGADLSKFHETCGNLRPKDALKAVRQILHGLQSAHDAGIIHRDLKPSNVIVDKKDKTKLRCVIIDFGISAFMETEGYTRLTRTGEQIAGGQYIDPRLMDDPKLRDVRSDVYSAGAILYFLLCGRAPVGSDIEDYLKNTNSKVDSTVLGIVRKSLASELDGRYSSCNEFINAINAIIGEEP